MKNSTVRFISYEPISKINYSTIKFEFRDDKKFKRIQRFCFYLLKKIGAYATEDSITYTEINFDSLDFINRILTQKDELRYLFNKKPTRLLIGAKEFNELMNLTYSFLQPIKFSTKYSFYDRGYNESIGLDVEVIPWMEGILVMPD